MQNNSFNIKYLLLKSNYVRKVYFSKVPRKNIILY